MVAASGIAAAEEPGEPLQVSEEEVLTFLSGFFEGLTTCNTDTLARKFADSARIRFISSYGRRQVLTPPQYIQWLRKDCRPYENLQWDQASTQVHTFGEQATVDMYLSWGANRGRRGRQGSTLMIQNRFQLFRWHGGLAIAGLAERFRELVPGAEEAFWTKAEHGGLMNGVAKFYRGLGEALREVQRRTHTLKRDSGL